MHYARLRLTTARFLIGAVFAALAVPSIAQTVLMGCHPLFDGLNPGTGIVPVEVDLANTGPDARGAVQVSVGDFAMTYPVELPQGTKKRLITYPDCGQYAQSGLQVDLITNRARLHQTVETNGFVGGGTISVLEIAESGGDLGFLKTSNGREPQPFPTNVAYVKPADAPDRPVGYDRVNAMVLGEGSERLSNDSVDAIKDWTLSGGTLIFIGGASAPILNDPRWAAAIPVRNATQKNFGGSNSLLNRYGSSPGQFTAMVGEPAENATTRANGLIMEKPFGLGRVIYLAFNPFENPMLLWNSRPKLFNELLNPSVMFGPQAVINTVIYSGNYPYNPYGSGRYSYYYYQGNNSANNPFRATLPPTSKVLLILTLYFFAVVPINFIVLRKLKRGELAWGTAPVISLAFAGVFFAAAQGLYSAELSTSTNGMLVAQAGEPNAMIIGYTQMYFPHGGRYDLKLSGVDSLLQTNTPDYRWDRSQHSIYEDLQPIDVGEVQAQINVPNLAFREMTYREHTKIEQMFDVHRLPNGHFSVTNGSDYTIVNARLVGGGGWQLIGDLKPHETVEKAFNHPTTSTDDMPSRLGQYLARLGALALTGRLRGYRAGPIIGNEVKDAPGLNLTYISNVKLKQSEMLDSAQMVSVD